MSRWEGIAVCANVLPRPSAIGTHNCIIWISQTFFEGDVFVSPIASIFPAIGHPFVSSQLRSSSIPFLQNSIFDHPICLVFFPEEIFGWPWIINFYICTHSQTIEITHRTEDRYIRIPGMAQNVSSGLSTHGIITATGNAFGFLNFASSISTSSSISIPISSETRKYDDGCANLERRL